MSSKLFCRRLSKLAVIALSLLLMSVSLVTGAGAEEALTVDGISVNKVNVYPGETVRVTVNWTNTTGYDVAATVICTAGSSNTYERPLTMDASGSGHIDFPIDLSAAWAAYDFKVITGNNTLKELPGAFTVKQIIAQENITSVSPSELSPVEVFAGDTVRVSLRYTSPANTKAVINVGNKASGSLEIKKTDPARIDSTELAIPAGTPAGDYNLAISFLGSAYQFTEGKAVKVRIKPAAVLNITAPTKSSPVTVRPGDNLTIKYSYSVSSDTPVNVRLVSGSNNLLVGKDVTLAKSSTSGSTVITVPTSAAAAKYNVVILPKDGGTALSTQQEAVLVENKLTASITAPTKSSPVTVRPGGNLTVKYSYSVSSDTPVNVRLVSGSNNLLVGKDVTLAKSSTSGSTVLTVPTSAAAAKYNVVILPKNGGTALSTQQEAVLVENKITANITSPTRSKPVTVAGGEKITITFDYTADVKSNVDVKIQQSDSEVLLTSTVALDKSTSTKHKSVTVTIPSSASGGEYNLVIKSSVSGTTLDTERDAVTVDAKVTADLTSPTRTKPVTIGAGGTLQVKFDYTSSAASSVEVKVLKKDGSSLATASTNLDKTTSQKSKTLSMNIPSSAAAGKYELVVTAKYSGRVLDTQTQAVIVEDPVAIRITSPTENSPTRFNTTGKVDVKFSYSAETSSDVEFRILKPDGKTLVKATQYLSRTSTNRSDNIRISLPAVTPAASYDIEVVSKDTGNRLALVQKAVIVTSYQVNTEVKFVIGQGGRWVNGTYQTTDLDARIIQGRTMLPIRHVGEPLGWELRWDDTSKMATVIKGDRQVRVWVNSSSGQVSTNNGNTWQTVRIDPDNASVQPLLITGRVLLPLRFVSEALDTRVDWDATTRTVIVNQD